MPADEARGGASGAGGGGGASDARGAAAGAPGAAGGRGHPRLRAQARRWLTQAFLPVYRAAVGEDAEWTATMRDRIDRANLAVTVEEYVAASMGVGAVCGAVLGLAAGGAGVAAVRADLVTLGIFPRPSPTALAAAAVASGATGAAAGVALGVVVAARYPERVAARRRREIDRTITDAVVFAYALSQGGTDTLEVIRELARAETFYGECAVEFQRVVAEMDLFNTDYRTALERVAEQTPSEPLRDLLLELATNERTGGDASAFLGRKKDQLLEDHRRAMGRELDRIEALAEGYMALVLLPVILIIVLVALGFQAPAALRALPLVVYAGMPAIGALFVLAAASATRDDQARAAMDDRDRDRVVPDPRHPTGAPAVTRTIEEYRAGRGGGGPGGGGDAPPDGGGGARTDGGPARTGAGVVEGVLRPLETRVRLRRLAALARDPRRVLRHRPALTLAASVPTALLVVGLLVRAGVARPTEAAMAADPLGQTAAWVVPPLLVVGVPYALAHRARVRHRRAVVAPLADALYKLRQANEAGQTFVAALEEATRNRDDPLSAELRAIPPRVRLGSRVDAELAALAERYRHPRLTRTVKLVTKAREASTDVADVLATTAEMNRIEEELRRDRLDRTTMYFAIVVAAFVVLLGVLFMFKVSFVDKIEALELGGAARDTGLGQLDPDRLHYLLLHAAVLQAFVSGVTGGYIRTQRLGDGAKYAVAFVLVALGAWGLGLAVT